MSKKSLFVAILILCMSLVIIGCQKKVVKEEPSVAKEEAAKETVRKEEAAKREEEMKKEFETNIVAKKEPGIQGEVFESKMLKDIHFAFDKYDIPPEEAAILKENAAYLKKVPNIKIQLEGHCDERGTIEYNLALGERRANKTKDYLISLGISAARISTISYGKEKPLDPGHNEEAWAKNRRAHTIITAK